MIPPKFEYQRAGSVDEAIALLGRHADAKLLAGGHSLLPMMKLRLAQPAVVIDIGRIGELKGICKEGDALWVGALTRHAEIATSELVRRECPLLADAAGEIGDPQVRNRGTLGGNIAHGDPGSDLPAVLVALGARVHMKGPRGERAVAAGDFFVDLLTTDLAADEVLTSVEVPVLAPGTGYSYLKVEHPASGYGLCGAVAVVRLSGGACTSARLTFNGVTAVPTDATAIHDALAGRPLTDEAIDRAVAEHLSIPDPLGDAYASGPYRVELARVYGRRALKEARDRAR